MNKHYIKYEIKRVIENIPQLHQFVLRIKHRKSNTLRRIAAPDSDICIEGYPRSANSFSVKSFRFANDSDGKILKISTHFHSPAQVRESVRLGIPTLVLIRQPEAAIVSLKALSMQLKKVQFPEQYPMEILAWKYVDFYKPLFNLRERICVATFEQVTNGFDEVILRFNKQFATSFKSLENTKENEAAVFKEGKIHLSPSPERQIIKDDLEREMCELIDSKCMIDARRVYEEFSALAHASTVPTAPAR